MDGARARGLRIWTPGAGRGLLEGRRVCARSGQQGGARGVLIVCCDGPAGLPEAARGGPGPTPWSPPAWSTPVRATRAVRRLRGPQGGRRRRAPEPAPPPTRRPPDGPRAPSASPTRAREYPQTAAGAGEGLGEEHRLPGLPPGPAPGHLCTTNAVRVAQPPSRAVRREARPLLSSDEAAARTAVAGGSATSRTAGPRSAPKMKNTPAHSRRANGWTRRRGGSPPTGAHRPRARPARRRLPRPNQPPSLTEPAYTETLTGSRGDLAGPGPGGPGPAPRQKSAGAHRRRRGHQADRGVPRPPQGVLLGGLQAPRLSRRRSTRRSPPRRGRPRTTPTGTPARGRTWPRSPACRA